jgi:sulfur-oxidizing protein SoxY
MMSQHSSPNSKRRRLLAGGVALGMVILTRPAGAAPDQLSTAIQEWTGGRAPTPGRVKFDIATLVDNGNAVPVTVSVDSPMTGTEHVTAIAIFNERNPQRDVARFTLGPHAGRASVSTRIRLATSQKLTAVARLSDGSTWSHTVDVVVTLAACIEGEA